ncbi:MATE family efflux transporter [Priestia taiwanensis]|uniref:MATE family efflux transporter n=1 Tax=Priestia taiwanensis TaxID=1347902 RepID=A0A917EMZ8_9BACI|nr:MATE family efflux transporter [Priestia taiwanensis]MBM7362498.1 putative MATE family efflux protein [Priestia taiwanensis]GGE62708.1 MATE family efflux transporter [Priestia taiwanensis]
MGSAATKAQVPLTEGPIGKTLFFFAMPVLLGNIMQSLNGSINSIWVGKFLGESALAATSNTNNIMFFLLSTIFGIGMASSILVAQNVGAQDLKQAKKVVGTSATFFLILSLLITALGIIFSSDIMRFMQTPDSVLPLATIYANIMFLGIPFTYAYSFIMTILRGSGDSKTPFYFLIICVILDIILNPILIFGFGPIPNMGIAGSALSTVIAQFITLICLVVFLYKKQYFLRITKAEFHLLKLDLPIVRALVFKGIPMGLQMIVVSSSGLALISLINSYGAEATAAYGAAAQLSNYVLMPAMAIGAAVSSMAAQNIGANKWDRVHKTTMTGIFFNFSLTGFLVIIIHLFNREALSLFLPSDSHAITIGMEINNITLWGFILFGITFVLSGVMRSAGSVTAPLVITFTALWVIRTPAAYILGNMYGIDAIWWSFPIGFITAVILSLLYYRFGNWKKAKMM